MIKMKEIINNANQRGKHVNEENKKKYHLH